PRSRLHRRRDREVYGGIDQDRGRVAFMVSLSNHEGAARTAVRTTSWFDKLTMKRFLPHEPTA
ncbi:MAG TPA: hypothetical protein VJ890_11695, partial [Vineibacter sp.]|nr:hypothetical protein [Vineibacter sp.]